MKSLRWRLTAWFASSLLAVALVLVAAAHWHLNAELRKEKWERTHPAHPDWVLHGSFTDQEVHDILRELLQFWLLVALPVVGLALLAAYGLARRSTRPVRDVNRQLARLGPNRLEERVQASDADPEFAELVQHLNRLLRRLEISFNHLRAYTGQVAHELRTPLQLMRLQVEANAAGMTPALAEGLQEELARLSNYVETALTIARAEQGHLETRPEAVALNGFLPEVIEPFGRLAAADRRRLLWSCSDHTIAWTDPAALKQILFNLLNNALKHGREDIWVRVRSRSHGIWILIGNLAAESTPRPATGLGIGLRLVRALAQQLDQTRFSLRHGRYFWVRLGLPSGAPGRMRHPAAGAGGGPLHQSNCQSRAVEA